MVGQLNIYFIVYLRHEAFHKVLIHLWNKLHFNLILL